MVDIYCGIGKTPKSHRVGTMRECAEKGQVRLYGINKIDPKTLKLAKQKNVLPETREKLILMMSSLRGAVRRNKGRYETTKDKELKPEYYKNWQKAQKDLETVVAKLKKIEEKRDIEKSKLEQKSKSKTKPKPKTDSKTKTDTKTKTDSKTKPKADPKSNPKPKPKADPKSKPKADSKSKPKSDSKADSKSKTKTKTTSTSKFKEPNKGNNKSK
nr:protein TonB-like [Hydra vulgaris]